MAEPPTRSAREHSASLVRPFVGAGGAVTQEPFMAEQLGTAVRPFLVTSGRVVSAAEMPVEAQVVVTDQGRGALQWLSFEYRDLVSLCGEPLAVAEIAARLNLHLGVIRVLITDLKQQGVVTTFSPEADIDVDTILRVIHGLRQRT